MKLSKVDKIRVAVGKTGKTENGNSQGRGVLYRSPKGNKTVAVDAVVEERIRNANRLYSAFFRCAYPEEPERHFEEIIKRMATGKKSGAQILKEYTGYEGQKNRKPYTFYVNKCAYRPAGKESGQVLRLFVKERLGQNWQNPEAAEAAVALLTCLCEGKTNRYTENTADGPVLTELSEQTVTQLEQVSRLGGSILVPKTERLEAIVTVIFRLTAEQCNTAIYVNGGTKEAQDADLEKQIAFLKSLQTKPLLLKERFDKVTKQTIRDEQKLSEFSYKDATKERMEAVVVRMRKTLKKGASREVAVELLQALAQYDGKTWDGWLTQMLETEASKKKLKDFILAVNKDFHHFHVIKSVKNTAVAVSHSEDNTLQLSGAKKKTKGAMQDTLFAYAQSEESSDETLLRIKRILFTYVLGGRQDNTLRLTEKTHLAKELLWKFRGTGAGLFDADFVPEEEREGESGRKAGSYTDLGCLFAEDDGIRNQRRIADRINYVNYGNYLRMRKTAEDEFTLFWCAYIKDYIEENYVTKIREARRTGGKRRLKETDCEAERMMEKCWHDIIRYICGKYIHIGKAVYHFAIPEDLLANPGEVRSFGDVHAKYADGITSFDYEDIKAEENLQKSIFNVLVSAVANYSRSVVDLNSERAEELRRLPGNERLNEDVLMMKEAHLKELLLPDAKKRLLRYFGGYSACEGLSGVTSEELAWEMRTVLSTLRNESFHYTFGKKKKLDYKVAKQLWMQAIRANRQLILDKYYSNNTCRYYSPNSIKALIEQGYRSYEEREAQIPAFKTVWKKAELAKYLADKKVMPAEISGEEKERVIFQGAFYFLLKEIYYREFTVGNTAAKYFFDAVERYCKENETGPYKNPAKSFNDYVNGAFNNKGVKVQKGLSDLYREGKITFGVVCQTIMAEYTQQNEKSEGEAIYQHFMMLFPLCMRKGFQKYVEEKHKELLQPVIREMGSREDFLTDIHIGCFDDFCREDGTYEYDWFVVAHLIHPKRLNELVGNLKDYMQFKQDILRRADYAEQFTKEELAAMKARTEEKLQKISGILRVAEFVRGIAGRVSNTFSDYYESAEAYAAYLEQYIEFPRIKGSTVFESFRDFCVNTLPGGAVMDVYMDEKNPRILRNVEVARMYAGGDTGLRTRKKVTAEELKRYYQNEPDIVRLLKAGLCATAEDQKRVKAQQELRNRITLTDVTEIQEVINDLLSQLVTFSYFRERDEMYLLLGFYYMALQSDGDWGEELRVFDGKKLQVENGFVLYQLLSAFTYGLNMYSEASPDGKGGSQAGKIGEFIKAHPNSWDRALRLFVDDGACEEVSRKARNYVDHFRYYVKPDRSILDLYAVYHEYFFGYSTKMRKSVLQNFASILERYFVVTKFKLGGERGAQTLEAELSGDKFTYKLSDTKAKPVVLPARNKEFLENLKNELNYRQE